MLNTNLSFRKISLLACAVLWPCLLAACAESSTDNAQVPVHIAYHIQLSVPLTEHVPAPVRLTKDQKKWLLATSAILSKRNCRPLDLLGDDEVTPKNIEETKTLLQDWWGINNREDLLSALEVLEREGQRAEFDYYAKNIDGPEFHNFMTNYANLCATAFAQSNMDQFKQMQNLSISLIRLKPMPPNLAIKALRLGTMDAM